MHPSNSGSDTALALEHHCKMGGNPAYGVFSSIFSIILNVNKLFHQLISSIYHWLRNLCK